MKNLISLLSIFLVGCIAFQIQYTPKMITNKDLAVQIIEQVVMEQPLKFRPEGVFVTDTYMDFGNFVIGKRSKLLKPINSTFRFYFNSLGKLELFKKRSWYVIQLKDDEDRVVKRIYTQSLKKAESLIDSISFFASRAKPFRGS